MQDTYWLNRWKNREIGWHQTEVEPGLVQGFGQVRPTRVLVPLCGKTLDMKWLLTQGHEVVGVELSALACESFFEENQIRFTKATEGEFICYLGEGSRIRIFQGDFFKFTSELLGKIGAVYDRAALIALPPEMRLRYATHLTQLIRSCSMPDFLFLQIALERDPLDTEGPPFSVTAEEIEELYSRIFSITPLSREVLSEKYSQKGGKMIESIYKLKLR
jgi:thiopurine S-methyltransferase